MSKHQEKSKGFVAGALLGTFLGGIAALLLAPKSGKETQSELKGRAKKVIKTADARLDEMETELNSYIDNLKLVARDLRGEAYEESQRLITRAQLLKNDLQDSAARLAKTKDTTSTGASADAKRLVSEGQTVLGELEKMTKKIMRTSKNEANEDDAN